MKFTKQDLLTMLIGLFLFASCKDTNTIGLDMDENFEIKGVKMDTTTVNSITMKDDVPSGVGLIRHPLGYMVDDVFGKTQADLALAVGIPSAKYRFGKTPSIDSAVLVLPYSTQFYGDTTVSNYTIVVRQLEKDISKATSYLTSTVWATSGSVRGTFTGKLKPNTKFKITDIVTGKPDTLKTVGPQIRIKLDNAFIQDNIINIDTLLYETTSKFFSSFKGLQLTASATGKGGIAFVDFINATDSKDKAAAKIEVYYKRQNATTATAIDTVAVNFPINTTTGPVTTTIKHDYAGTDIETQLAGQPSASYAVTYLQALAGLKNKISFPYLKNFISDLRAKYTAKTTVVVNKAELVIDLNEGTDAVPFSAAQRLALYRFDIAGQRANVPDNDNSVQGSYNGDPRALGNELLFGGYFDSVNKRYIFTITSYIQDLLDGKTEDYGTFLAPSSLTEFNISPPVTSAARSVIHKYKKGAAPADKRLRLNIYYTQIN